jgi:hypothetical protein
MCIYKVIPEILILPCMPWTLKKFNKLIEKTKYMLLSCHQNAGQNHDIKIGNRCFEDVARFRYLGMTITYQNLIQMEIKKRLNLGNAYYHSVQNLLSSPDV